jgi:hypothetical protein
MPFVKYRQPEKKYLVDVDTLVTCECSGGRADWSREGKRERETILTVLF